MSNDEMATPGELEWFHRDDYPLTCAFLTDVLGGHSLALDTNRIEGNGVSVNWDAALKMSDTATGILGAVRVLRRFEAWGGSDPLVLKFVHYVERLFPELHDQEE